MLNFFDSNTNKWINFWVFIFCISVLAAPGHGGEAAIVLLSTMIFIFFRNPIERAKFKLSQDELIFILIVLFFWLLNILGAFFQSEGFEYNDFRKSLRSIDNPMRWLLMMPIFFLFRRQIISWKIVAIGLSIGVFISVGIAIYQVQFLDIVRARGSMNHTITFGELMVATDLILWVFMIIAWTNNNKLIASIIFIASLVAFYGSLLSATRGAWLAYLFLFLTFVFLAIKGKKFNKQKLFSKPIILRIIFAICVLFFTAQTQQYQTIEERSLATLHQFSQGNYDSASGGRVPIFRTAIEIAKNFPMGVGTDNFRAGGKKIIIMDAMENKVSVKNQKDEIINVYGLKDDQKNIYIQSYNSDGSIRFTSRFRHAHNEWLNVLAENGWLGFISLILVFVFPIYIFWKNLKNDNYLINAYAYCGMLLILCFAIFGQSQSIFTSHAALIFFIFFLYFFIGQISALKKELIPR